MAKNLKEFIQCGRDPAYLKNGDIITEELAWEVVGQEGYADGCLDQEFEITQSHIVEDIIGGEGVYETIYRESPDHPWPWIGARFLSFPAAHSPMYCHGWSGLSL